MSSSGQVLRHRFTPTDPRLGRHVEHDVRSRNFPMTASRAKLKTTLWKGHAPGLDQGETGSCTGNSTAQLINLDKFTDARAKVIGPSKFLAETYARDTIYHLATVLDSFPGTYPPDDSGSSGLGAAKASVKLGFTGIYRHALSFNTLIHGLQTGPCIVGTAWYDDMMKLDRNFYCKPGGDMAGGHEYLCLGVDVDKEELWFRQSWGQTWGTEIPNVCPSQAFRMTFKVFQLLLADDGDATFLDPVIA